VQAVGATLQRFSFWHHFSGSELLSERHGSPVAAEDKKYRTDCRRLRTIWLLG